MATQEYRIVPGKESAIHDEPHIEGSRITVLYVHEQVESRGVSPETVANNHGLDVADVYDALAYYRRNQDEMSQVQDRRKRALEEAAERSDLDPPGDASP